MSIVFFAIYLAANFVWVLIVVGGLMTRFMPRNDNRNRIILSVSFALSLLLTLAVINRGPDHDDGINSDCQFSRAGTSC